MRDAGKGIDIHLSIAAVLDFYDAEGKWPGIHDNADAEKVVELAKGISEARKGTDGSCWAQSVSWGFPSGDDRDLDADSVGRFARLFQTELTGLCLLRPQQTLVRLPRCAPSSPSPSPQVP